MITLATRRLIVTSSLLVASLFAGCGAHKDASDATPQAMAVSTQDSASSAPAATDPSPGGNTASADFPAGTTLGALGLPVYPVPDIKKWTTVDEPSVADGKKLELMNIAPPVKLVNFDTVYAWYKAHMPSGTDTANGDTRSADGGQHATFRIGSDGDKVVRMVMLAQYAGDSEMTIALRRETRQ